LLRLAGGNQQRPARSASTRPFIATPAFFLQRPLTPITTPKIPLRYAYRTLELNHHQAIEGGQVLLDLDRRLREDL
jgi:hypothetical protein